MSDATGRWADACCHKCETKVARHLLSRPFIVCPTCGNKRCPKASDHELTCTNSNAAGQPGSVYT